MFEEERLKRLAATPNTTVFKTEYGEAHEAWKVDRLRGVAETIAARTTEFDADASAFQLRKRLMQDEDVLTFQRAHPKLFWMLTDRTMVGDARFRQALGAMFTVREKVERGEVEDGRDADALATSGIVSALQQPSP